ncbi:ParB/RepB/Spo0J family partition protein [Edaphobacter modestus]|uniref:ParB family chromosome partitioning protein n=1 Tax=Edaphobacter modestus TaxID=388466 RepID=A0A4Q7YXA2_9BACT|nr:ParB/RepB/Spo0J family partition protein [Edaphobacter modestus]RZU41715.1 ParB family chromosome partitioning protein [Edaphobacter modestus]
MPTASSDTKRRALGKGLESLLPQRNAAPTPVPAIHAAAAPEPAGRPLEIPLDHIERNPWQTRKHFDEAQLAELAQSIAATGVVQPIVVRPIPPLATQPPGHNPMRYQLITGERRWLASRKAGKTTIPSIVRQVADEQVLEMTIVENLQRTDLNPMEQARAYQRLSQEFKLTQEQMATRTGKERASVANFLRLLRLPEAVQAKVEGAELTFGHARALLALESPEAITSAAQKVVALSFSVRQTENYVQGLINPEAKEKKDKPQQAQTEDPNVREAEDRLRRTLGLKVKIEDKKGKGRVIIEYSGLEDFDTLLEMLGDK